MIGLDGAMSSYDEIKAHLTDLDLTSPAWSAVMAKLAPKTSLEMVKIGFPVLQTLLAKSREVLLLS